MKMKVCLFYKWGIFVWLIEIIKWFKSFVYESLLLYGRRWL